MVGKRGASSKIYPMARAALRGIDLLPKDPDLMDNHTRIVADFFRAKAETTKEVRKIYGDEPSIQVLANVGVLKLAFGCSNKDVSQAILGKYQELKKALRLNAHDIAQRAHAYSQAQNKFPELEAALTSGRPFTEIDLFTELLAQPEGTKPRLAESVLTNVPLYTAQLTEKLLESEAYETREPDALCRAAEHFSSLGDDRRAWELIDEVITAAPDHPGAWYQKARLLLKQAEATRRDAARMRMLSEDGEALSATESHFEEMAECELLSAHKLRRQAFDASLKAFSLLPGRAEYEGAAVNWSSDYGSLRRLRQKMLEFIVREAGDYCHPYRENSELHERIEARLGRTRDIVFPPRPEYAGPGFEVVAAPEKMARLSALPLFSENTDAMLPRAYEELKKCGSLDNFLGLRLAALNILRVLAPADEYRQEVKEFADSLLWGDPHTVGLYFGTFPGFSDPGEWRRMMHEHLGSVMNLAAQRALADQIYTRWHDNIEKRRIAAVVSIYNQELRTLFEAGEIIAAYDAARRAETEGIYRRDDEWGAITLTRLAQHAAHALGGVDNAPEAIREHLSDTAMRDLAEGWYDEYCANDDDGIPIADLPEAYLTPPSDYLISPSS